MDGPIHERQAEYDTERDTILAGYGLHLLRIPNADIRADLPAVLARIRAACQATAAP